MLDKNKKAPKESSEKSNSYMKYSGMAFQMGAIILVGVFIGKKMDAYFETTEPYLLVAMALFSIFAALYSTLKDLI